MERTSGVFRKVDGLGRVVLPAELRRHLGIDEGDFLEVGTDQGRIVLTKVEERCVFCGTAFDLRTYRDRKVCQGCIVRLSEGF